MKHMYTIAFDGIVLKPFDVEASEEYRILRNKPDVCKWFTFKANISLVQQNQWFQKYLNNPQDIMFSIFNEHGLFVGANSIYNINNEIAEYGRLIINPLYARNGYGYRGTYAAALIAREQLKLKYLNLEVYSNNLVALKLYQKVGFVETGVMTDSSGLQMKTMTLELKNIIGGK